jgi:transcription-repair coupling factor (superfamily II helicase)
VDVAAIRAGKNPALDAPLPQHQEINLRVPALIPDDYLPDVHSRLILYKRIASAADRDERDALKAEVIDRFGPLPPAARTLFRVTELKLMAGDLGIDRIDIGPRGGRIESRTIRARSVRTGEARTRTRRTALKAATGWHRRVTGRRGVVSVGQRHRRASTASRHARVSA